MTEIVPAIMPKTFEELKESLEAVRGLVHSVQIDVMDGRFVPNKSWPYIHVPDADFSRILKEEDGLPFWDEIDFEVDMMISNPAEAWREWVQAGASRIIVHIESVKNAVVLFEEIKKELPGKDSFLNTELGVAIDIDTPTESLNTILDYVDFVQFMGIEKIGFQGQSFDERVVEKIKNFRANNSTMTISVDGGVNLDTVEILVAAGADRLAVGSAIFGQEDVRGALENIQNAVADN